MKLNIDRSAWKKVKLGDVAFEYSKRINNPSKSEFDRFVGSSNIDQWDFRVKSWEPTDSVTSAMKLFEPDDYLLVRRSLYASDFRERAPRAHFSGVCSGDILTIRENPELIADGFLIGVLNSPALWKFVVANASGSITRRIKWKDLCNYEFLLPPKEQQVHVGKLFWAVDSVIEKENILLEKAKQQLVVHNEKWVLEGFGNSTVTSTALKKDIAEGWLDTTIGELIKLGYIVGVQDGNHGDRHPKASDYTDDGIPFIMANTLVNGEIRLAEAKKIPQVKTDKLRIGFSKSGDVLLSHKGTVGEVAIVPDKLEWPYLMLTPQVTYYRTDNMKLDREFLYFSFSSSYFQRQLLRLSSQSTRAYVGITAQRNLKIAIPNNIEEQREIALRLKEINTNIKQIRTTLFTSEDLKKNLVNGVF